MATKRELRWKIDAYSAETMPLGRLAEYLRELATMFDNAGGVHLIRVESSSTVPVMRVDDETISDVYERADAIRLGTAPTTAMQSYRKVNRMLREDKTSAVLYEGSAEVIPFPGKSEMEGSISGIQQQGTLDGKLLKVGGAKEWVPVQLQTPDEELITGCYARRSVAKEMAPYLFDPIRLYGRGRWNRSVQGRWSLETFWVDSFERLDNRPLLDVVASLRSIRADWKPTPIANIRSLRDSNGEHD